MHDGRLLDAASVRHKGHLLQSLADFGGLAEGAGILAAVMADHCTVKLLLGTAASTPLEVANAVRPMGHSLQGRQLGDAGALLLADRLPVSKAGAGLHHQERLALQRIVQVVHHRRVQGSLLDGLGGLVPGGVVVPAGHVDLLGKVKVVDVVEAIHHVDGELRLGGQFPHAIALPLVKIDALVADEPLPVQSQTLHGVLSMGRRAFDLAPFGVVVAPKGGIPGFVQRVQAAVTLLQPGAESVLAQLAAALAAKLVADVPQDHGRVITEALGQFAVDDGHFFAVDRRSVAVVLAAVVQFAHAVAAHTAHLGVLLGQPGRACGAGRGQNGGDTVGVQVVDDVRQPIQVKLALLRLDGGPGEHAQRNYVDMCFFHQFHIFGQNIRAVQPLFRVIISAMEKFIERHSFSSALRLHKK